MSTQGAPCPAARLVTCDTQAMPPTHLALPRHLQAAPAAATAADRRCVLAGRPSERPGARHQLRVLPAPPVVGDGAGHGCDGRRDTATRTLALTGLQHHEPIATQPCSPARHTFERAHLQLGRLQGGRSAVQPPCLQHPGTQARTQLPALPCGAVCHRQRPLPCACTRDCIPRQQALLAMAPCLTALCAAALEATQTPLQQHLPLHSGDRCGDGAQPQSVHRQAQPCAPCGCQHTACAERRGLLRAVSDVLAPLCNALAQQQLVVGPCATAAVGCPLACVAGGVVPCLRVQRAHVVADLSG
jgi:hypothetical protein